MKTKLWSVEEIIRNIEQETLFEAQEQSGEFSIKIARYVPFCCTAIHSGSKLRPELQAKIALNEFQRWYEEDPFTDLFIQSMPITLVGHDSRYEYDLNRSPEDCIYTEAWGQQVWKKKLSNTDLRISRRKHANYYRVLHALLKKLEEKFGAALLYDIHSYNYRRWNRVVPVFNIGTERIDHDRYRKSIDHWKTELSKIQLSNTHVDVAENDVFKGHGYNLAYATAHFPHTLVLATEVKKVYCDEQNGDAFPSIIKELQQQFKTAILNHASVFSQEFGNWQPESKLKLLGKKIDSTLVKVDKKLFSLVKHFELLASVNPTNTPSEKNKFFRSKFTQPPQFTYQPIRFNPYILKQELLSLRVQDIEDISIRSLYESTVNSFFDKIDLLRTLNTPRFLYNSLRYFGRPSAQDLRNAAYLLHLPPIPGAARKEPIYDAKQAREMFTSALAAYGFQAKTELSNMVISKVMVLNSKQSILIQPNAHFRKKELLALVEHEIGVHMLTSKNARKQELKILQAGLPLNTLTQEGLAILAEYLSGNLSLTRLKKLALRVLMVDRMVNGVDFVTCFQELHRDYELDANEAFNLLTRIFRGGGFTKDFLYLAGFVQVLRFWEEQHDLGPLLTGKTALAYYPTLVEMLERELITPPHYVTNSFIHPAIDKNDPLFTYLLSGLR